MTEKFDETDGGGLKLKDVVKWEKTGYLMERLQDHPFFEEPDEEVLFGMYQGRHIIGSARHKGEHVPINGGVYMGAHRREAIVVDENEDPYLLMTYADLITRRGVKYDRGIEFKSGILREIFDLVEEKLPYDSDAVDRFIIANNLHDDKKVQLGAFMVEKCGVCRHQAVLVGYLLERLINDELINGQVSIERNSIKFSGGHAWVRYVNSKGMIYIIDPAQKYCGPLERIPDEDQEFYKNVLWDYKRPEEYTSE